MKTMYGTLLVLLTLVLAACAPGAAPTQLPTTEPTAIPTQTTAPTEAPTPTEAPALPDTSAINDIVDTAVADGRFTTLVAALQAADLAGTLKGEGPFTVFAPTDEAFAKLPAGTVEGLLKDIPQLKNILLYHVVEGKVMAADVVSLTSAETLLGEPVAITTQGDMVKINDAQVMITDIETSNGVIHVLDSVLLPPQAAGEVETTETAETAGDGAAQDIVDTAIADGRFTILASALQSAGLIDALKGEGPFTVFAPTDDAFTKLPAGTLESLTSEQLKNILLYHVVEGEVPAADVVGLNGQEVNTLLGQPVTVMVEGDTVKINDAQVIITDIETANGIIHVIDAVLLPPQ